MSKREAMAAQIMAGIAADPEATGEPAKIAECAVAWADALLAALANESKETAA
jgi:hypothetical protein